MIGHPPRTAADWDLPAADVAAQVTVSTLRQALEATHSESDRIAYLLEIRHTEAEQQHRSAVRQAAKAVTA